MKLKILKDCGIGKAGQTVDIDEKVIDVAELVRVEAVEPAKATAKGKPAKG
jgi:hypothetical protein